MWVKFTGLLLIPQILLAADLTLPKHQLNQHQVGETKQVQALDEVAELPEVFLFRTPICGACDQAALFLRQKNIAFVSRDVRESRATFADFVRNAAGRLPQIVIDNVRIDGFVPTRIEEVYQDALLKRQKQRQATP